MNIIIFSVIAAGAGFLLGYFVRQSISRNRVNSAEGKIEKLVEVADKKSEELVLTAKKQAVEILEQAKKKEDEREQQIIRNEQRLEKRENSLDQKIEEIEQTKKILEQKVEEVRKIRKESEETRERELERLEKIAGLSKDQAKSILLQLTEEENRAALAERIAKIEREGNDEIEKRAKNIMTSVIQKYAGSHSVEVVTTTVSIPSDEVKGRIIGREGRNIKALEKLTGVEIIVDDTPEAIILSCFDPIRREIARLSLHRLVTDGRIHPARIEEIVAKTKKQLEEEIVEIGERTCVELGIHGLHPELIRMVGRMRYRSSYGQNLLQHSREVAHLCATMAAELGLNVKLAKRAGLLHDIGKVPDDDAETPHALLGMKLADKYKEHPEVVNAIGAHHDEVEMTSILSPIIQACDAISGSRPGARREDSENYMKRLKDLENIALSYPGVEKAYAIQAGRELRVMVESEKVTDDQADILSLNLSTRIQTEMTYPGQIKITVIREKRSVNFAK